MSDVIQLPAPTREMVEAGARVLNALLDETPSEQLVQRIYHAMRSKAQKCDCKDGE